MRLLTTTVAFLGACLLLSGCATGAQSPSSPAASSSPSRTLSAATPTPTAAPVVAPTLVPEGTARQNLAYFNSVIEQAIAADPALDSYGVAVIVSQSGFPAESVQFTFSRTAVGLVADSVDIAVLWAGQCLIGQYGPALPKYHGIVLPALEQGGCLIGAQVQGL